MDEIIRRIIRWKERAKWSVRHDHSDDGITRILQEGVNLGHELEEEWLKTFPEPWPRRHRPLNVCLLCGALLPVRSQNCSRPDAAQPSASDARPGSA